MLDHAIGSDLENLGKLYGITRKLIKSEDKSVTPAIENMYENHKNLRERIMEAPKGLSVAGPKSAYIYYGKLAEDKVKDISASSNAPMEIDIRVLSYDGNGKADDALLISVFNKLNAQEIRPMGDKVNVASAEIIEFSLDLEVSFKPSNVVDRAKIINQIKDNLKDYVELEHKIGGLISQAGIYSVSYLEHVEDVVIKSPINNIKCDNTQAPFCLEIKVAEKKEE